MFPTSDAEADQRWAYGTGFADPFAGLDLAAPSDDPELALRCLMLGDDALIYSHRLQQWVTRMPELEEETALANIALDVLGQARLLLTRAGHLLSSDAPRRLTEDRLAFFRSAEEFHNVRLVARRDRDFAELVARLLVFATWRLDLLHRLRSCADPALAAIAAKGAIELAYHRDYAAGWVIRLGDGTDLSHQRMAAALEVVWPYLPELRERSAALGTPTDDLETTLDPVLSAATLRRPPSSSTVDADDDALAEILDELQDVARAHPLGVW